MRAQDAGFSGTGDPVLLEWTAEEGRILLTHDVSTMTRYAYDRVRTGRPMPGVFEISRKTPIGDVINDILLIADASLPQEWAGQVRYLLLR